MYQDLGPEGSHTIECSRPCGCLMQIHPHGSTALPLSVEQTRCIKELCKAGIIINFHYYFTVFSLTPRPVILIRLYTMFPVRLIVSIMCDVLPLCELEAWVI